MVSSVASAPYYSYLNQLEGVADSALTPAATGSASGASSPTGTAATPQASTAQSLVSSLLGNGNGFSSEILSLLQENSSGSFDPITSLLGGAGTNNALTSVYANLYASASAASLTSAQDNNTPQTTTPTPQPASAQNLISAQTQASIAYNQTLVQNAANVAKANSYGPDGVTPLVA